MDPFEARFWVWSALTTALPFLLAQLRDRILVRVLVIVVVGVVLVMFDRMVSLI